MENHLLRSTLVFALVFIFFSCSPSDDGEDSGKGKHETDITGVAQKGQFIKGSPITIYAMDNNLNATGLSYPTQTMDDMGSFAVSNVDADFIDVKANGYFYNENRGETSESTISLQTVAATESHVNVNLLTTLAYNRIKRLVREGTNFADAQRRAQIEVLTALKLGNSTSVNFIDMNIAGNGDANGLLLAASLLIQQDRSVGDVSKLISDIAADLEEDGLLSDELNEEIHRNEHNLSVGIVISDLIAFYEKNGIEDFNIPTFYKFLDTDSDGRMDGTAGCIFQCIDVANVYEENNPGTAINLGYDAEGFSLSPRFLSTTPFVAKSDVGWLTVRTRTITENIYAVDIVAQPNTGENRTAHIIYTDESGKELATYTYQQKAPDELIPQRLFIGYNTEMENLLIEQVGVNGKIYNVSVLPNDGQYLYGYMRYIDIPYTDKQDKYQAYFPTHMMSMPDGYGMYRLTIPSNFTSDEFPFISQREAGVFGSIGNPDMLRFIQAAPSVVLDLVADDTDYVILSSDAPLTGAVAYPICYGEVDMTNPQLDETTLRPDKNGLYTLFVKIKHHDTDHQSFYIPVLLPDIRVTIKYYTADGQLGFTQYSTSRNYRISF
ncbi:MAG: hypothetical protein IJT97_05465 [Bacteroidaceae bacterium]|nr:hypothetical protein [Bacteroidaceae bacterium]